MQKRDLTRYSDYFTVSIPNSQIQALSILLLGILAGGVASLIVHWGTGNTTSIMTLGASSGILIISVPAFLTVLLIRIVRRKMKMKHAMFAVLAISAAYAAFMVIDASVYHFLNNGALAYVLLILVNAGIYGYWLVINKIAVGQKKSAIITSQVQPVLNVLMFLPFGGYLLNVAVPVDIAIIKLFAGILVFLIMGYLAIYLLDRPAKKNLYVSSI
ncbi:MAG: DUF2070 family protein, partial [Candidatus Micrarchaeota archaeon]|nr:DUF2070 family protein [Candidatus Micrarchaeota archaeon]